MRPKSLAIQIVSLLSLALPVLLLAQAAHRNRTLLVSGHSGEIPVVEMEGHSYVEVEELTRLIKGSLSFTENQIIMTVPAATPMPASTPAASQPPPSDFSKEFIRAGIEEMAVIREWRSTLRTAVQRGYPVIEDWVDNYQARAEQSLRLASVAASTDSDREAFQLLTNEYANMKALSDRILQVHKSRTYIPPDSLNNDPLDQRILNCARSMAAMAASGKFIDEGSCH